MILYNELEVYASFQVLKQNASFSQQHHELLVVFARDQLSFELSFHFPLSHVPKINK
jgi:hypothetical protein